MTGPVKQGPGDAALSRYLGALAFPTRLALLRKLQLPHALHEIELPAVRPREALAPERPLSRQGVQEHLAKLVEAGLVEARVREAGGRATTEYVVNQARLFMVTEEFRLLSLLRPVRAPSESTPTGAGSEDEAPAPLPEGPSLILASGPLEGRAFPLEGRGPWIIGRDRGCDAALHFDPFVSKHNARVVRTGARGYAVEAIGDARNGTRVNWRPLPEGRQEPLRAGDFVGVGRSLLVLRGG